MSGSENALPKGGLEKSAQNSGKAYEMDRKSRPLLAATVLWCFLLVDTILWNWPWGLGLSAVGLLWYVLVLWELGLGCLKRREDRVLLVVNLALLISFALTSNGWFRAWNFLALAALVCLGVYRSLSLIHICRCRRRG